MARQSRKLSQQCDKNFQGLEAAFLEPAVGVKLERQSH